MSRQIPPLFWSDGFIAYNLRRVLVITDYELMMRLFKDPRVNLRLNTPKGYLAQRYERTERGIDELSDRLELRVFY